MQNKNEKILEAISEKPGDYTFQINEFFIVPKLEVYNKEGLLVYVNDQSHLHKLSGTMNPEYAKKFIDDIRSEVKNAVVGEIKKRISQKTQQENNK